MSRTRYKLDVKRGRSRRSKKSKKEPYKTKKNRFLCVSSEEDIKTLMITIFKDTIFCSIKHAMMWMDPTMMMMKMKRKKMLTPLLFAGL
jgi:hypothetical protein